jgi:long-chain acyl-CoA synthetase
VSNSQPDSQPSIHQRFRQVARTHGDRVALRIDERAWSYAELLAHVESRATQLTSAGVQPGNAVALVLPNGFELVVSALASFAAGAILAPLNPKFRDAELQHHLQQCRPKVVLREGPPTVSSVSAPTEPAVSGVFMFSSGSTGKSKRITRTQRQLLGEYEALAQRLELSHDDRVLCAVPLFHAHGFCNALLAALLSGATLILSSGEFNARSTMRVLSERQVTVFPAVPILFKLLVETQFEPVPDLSSLRWPISAGAPLPESVAEGFLRRFGKAIHQLYGTTETGAITVQEQLVATPGSVGRALLGSEIAVRDEGDRALSSGEEGEVCVRALTATQQYDGLPEQTAQSFRAGWFYTGDLGHLDASGELFITGRKKLLINVAGYKVDPLEVEQVLAQHPAVAEVVVLGVDLGAQGEKVKAAVVLKPAHSCSERELIAYAHEHLAEHKVPRMVEFIAEIPRSALGKILRKDL